MQRLLHAGAGVAATLVAATACAATPTPVPPVRDVISAEVPSGTSLTLLVRDRTGAVRATGDPVRTSQAGDPDASRQAPARLTFTGRTGPGQSGAPLPDGRYSLVARDDAGVLVPVRPSRVVIDTTAPLLALTVTTDGRPRVRVRDLSAVRVRIEAVDAAGRRLASTGWSDGVTGLRLPAPALAWAGGRTVLLRAVGRDEPGNVGTSATTAFATERPGPARIVRLAPGVGRRVALVFDDGYSDAGMRRILTIARDRGVGVTFCLNAVNRPVWSASLIRMMRESVDDGTLELCNHGYSHRTELRTSDAAVTRDIARNATVLRRVIGAPVGPYYRPPEGLYTTVSTAAAGRLGFRTILMWSVDPADYLRPAPSVLAGRVVSGMRPGGILVAHLIPTSADALAAIIDGLRARGLTPVTIGALLGGPSRARPAPRDGGARRASPAPGGSRNEGAPAPGAADERTPAGAGATPEA